MAVLGAEPDFEVVGQAGTVADTLRSLRQLRPDLVLLDHHLPDGEGIGACADLLRLQPSLRIVILTVFGTPELARRALAAGARGFVTKSGEPRRVVIAIRKVLEGQHPSDVGTSGESLTQQELDVLALVAEGYTNARIGGRLGISAETVKSHLRSVMIKLGAANRTDAATVAVTRGLVRRPQR